MKLVSTKTLRWPQKEFIFEWINKTKKLWENKKPLMLDFFSRADPQSVLSEVFKLINLPQEHVALALKVIESINSPIRVNLREIRE